MDMMSLSLPQSNTFVQDYLANDETASHFFDYQIADDVYKARWRELQDRSFPREALCQHLHTYNKALGAGMKTMANIEKLREGDTTAVVAGQQAGVLTGPLYTINKCISIIKLAEQQASALQKPVVPVFWVAGEDHDFAEINHTFVYQNQHIKKKSVDSHQGLSKQPVSNIELDHETMQQWVTSILTSFPETEHTRDVQQFLNETLQASTTYVTWFARIIMRLFQDYGLILLDSNHEQLRNIESPYMQTLIKHNQALNEHVLTQIGQLSSQGYSTTLDVGEQSAHLFYHYEGERVLLERDDRGDFCDKQQTLRFSEAELLDMAQQHPEYLSNNVVTRPFMQEQLFPTLAFIGGPSEMAYWGTLQSAFRHFGCRVPPIVPRMNITYVDRHMEKWLRERNIRLTDVLHNGVATAKEQWLSDQVEWPVEETTEQVKEDIDAAHQTLRRLAVDVDAHLDHLAHKNISLILGQVDYLTAQINKAYRQPYQRQLDRFEKIEAFLHPFNGLQERTWNVVPLLNQHGFTWLKQLLEEELVCQGDHKVVYV